MIAHFAARAQSWTELILSLGRREGPRHTLHQAMVVTLLFLHWDPWQQSVVADMHPYIWLPHFMKAFPFTGAVACAACCPVCSSDATIVWEQPGKTPLTVRCRAGWWSCNIRYIRMRYFAACGMCHRVAVRWCGAAASISSLLVVLELFGWLCDRCDLCDPRALFVCPCSCCTFKFQTGVEVCGRATLLPCLLYVVALRGAARC